MALVDVQAVPIPERLAGLPRDPRGYPIFFTIAGPDGKYDFKGVYAVKVLACFRGRLCGLCGQDLSYWLAVVGGSASIENRVFPEPAMHRDCAEYAFAVCPYLLMGGYDRSNRRSLVEQAATFDPEGTVTKPGRMGMGITRRYDLLLEKGRAPLIRTAPFKEVVWYEGGVPVDATE